MTFTGRSSTLDYDQTPVLYILLYVSESFFTPNTQYGTEPFQSFSASVFFKALMLSGYKTKCDFVHG